MSRLVVLTLEIQCPPGVLPLLRSQKTHDGHKIQTLPASCSPLPTNRPSQIYLNLFCARDTVKFRILVMSHILTAGYVPTKPAMSFYIQFHVATYKMATYTIL